MDIITIKLGNCLLWLSESKKKTYSDWKHQLVVIIGDLWNKNDTLFTNRNSSNNKSQNFF